MDEIKALVPEGYRDVLSLDTTRPARLCVGDRWLCDTAYKIRIRGMATKIPGWFFTAYQSAQFFGQQLISEIQMRAILEDYFNTYSGTREKYEEIIEGYNFTEMIPKYKLFIKLNPNITAMRREEIANGVRSYFRDSFTILIDLKEALTAVDASLLLFTVFVSVIGIIALTLAFFLLMVSTTQNVKENIWEYGCLRAIGYTKNQGMRSFMYEQYSVIISSLFLGTLVGLLVASICTAQFFLFLEFKFELDFPKELLQVMVYMALITTFFAVFLPVREVNNQKIATTIKGLSTT
jgi:ABC-type antimicrobial peptide transport system permease subunit